MDDTSAKLARIITPIFNNTTTTNTNPNSRPKRLFSVRTVTPTSGSDHTEPNCPMASLSQSLTSNLTDRSPPLSTPYIVNDASLGKQVNTGGCVSICDAIPKEPLGCVAP
ncbi:hypothetical protein FZEAL_4099 [Fusarium zealandicum]|uniref:Uncharacterized protein n=1 Tax=Fusarium zealandicum TaxID=1053134 RepID=A0A8H4UMA6_9HYPO|nr:hypothetical protein FZEAL_4099 [Fusarium zealandicum]